jgi:L-alanine-DL-glutamate epimerase-like enolase superfamily enzyme
VIQAQAAVDLALWDIKGKMANLPVYKLLGAARERAPVYGSDGGWLYMSVPQMLTEFEAYLEQGMAGVKMKIGHDDPAIDVARVREVRKALGDNVWVAVDANQKWDYPTALRVGRELEQLNVAWFEEPLLCEDIAGHARLASDLDIPIALGESLGSRFEFDAYLRADAVDIVQPDVIRAGGITETIKIATLAETAHRPVELHHMMEVSIHIACGVLESGKIEFMPWIAAAFAEPAIIEDGYMRPPPKAGLGLDIADEVLTRYRVE